MFLPNDNEAICSLQQLDQLLLLDLFHSQYKESKCNLRFITNSLQIYFLKNIKLGKLNHTETGTNHDRRKKSEMKKNRFIGKNGSLFAYYVILCRANYINNK